MDSPAPVPVGLCILDPLETDVLCISLLYGLHGCTRVMWHVASPLPEACDISTIAVPPAHGDQPPLHGDSRLNLCCAHLSGARQHHIRSLARLEAFNADPVTDADTATDADVLLTACSIPSAE